MKRVIVGFSGPINSGKSTAAEALQQIGFVRKRFAAPLKAMLRAFYLECGLTHGEVDRRIEGDLKEKPCALLGGKTPRYAMQTLGTDWGRAMIHEDLWTNAWCCAVNSLAADVPVVVEDVRFDNEVAAAHDLGAIVIGLEREGTGGGAHASEQFDFTPDYKLINEDIEQFRRRVVALAAARLQLDQQDAA